MAMWVIEMPALSATGRSASTTSNFRWFSDRERSNCRMTYSPRRCARPARESCSGSTSRRYFPVSQPRHSGDHTMTPIPWRWVTGSTSRSICRARMEYGGCSQRNRSRPRRSLTHCASWICQPWNVDEPNARIFP